MDSIATKLPTEKANEEQKAARIKLFQSFDPNGNGYVSLAECDRGCRDILNLPASHLPSPVIMRAYQAARSVAQKNDNTEKTTSRGDDYLEQSEFRLFLVYLSRYLELWALFSSMDNNQDRRISYEEFQSTGLPKKLTEWGIINNSSDPHELFNTMDENGGGMVLFDEFAKWAVAEAIQMEGKD